MIFSINRLVLYFQIPAFPSSWTTNRSNRHHKNTSDSNNYSDEDSLSSCSLPDNDECPDGRAETKFLFGNKDHSQRQLFDNDQFLDQGMNEYESGSLLYEQCYRPEAFDDRLHALQQLQQQQQSCQPQYRLRWENILAQAPPTSIKSN